MGGREVGMLLLSNYVLACKRRRVKENENEAGGERVSRVVKGAVVRHYIKKVVNRFQETSGGGMDLLSIQRLAGNHEVHGGEEVLLSTGNEAVGSDGESIGGLLSSLWRNSEGFHSSDELVHDSTSNLGHTEDTKEVDEGTGVLELTGNWVVPWDWVTTLSQILMVLQLETGSLDGSETLADADHLGDTITNLNTVADLTVLWVLLIVVVGHEPLVDTEASSWLQDLEDLAVDTLEGWGVDGSLDGVDVVEGVWLEAHLHEISLDEFLFV